MKTPTPPTPAVMAGPSRLTARPVHAPVVSVPAPARTRPPDSSSSAITPLDTPKLLAARHLAVTACPYLAVALHAMAVVPSRAVRTMAVDRHWRCYVNPRFVAETPVRELAAVWLHEVSHLVRDHHGRAERLREASVRHEAVGRAGTAALDPDQPVRDRVRLNLAMDLEINDDLLEGVAGTGEDGTGPRLPPGALSPAKLRLPERDLFEEYLRDLTPTIVDSFLEQQLNCGSGAHNGSGPWEEDAEGAHPLGPYEAESIRISVRDAVTAGRGTAPAGWRRWAEDHGKSPQDWRTLLGAAFRTSLGAAGGAGDYTYRRPGRRTQSLGGGVVLPSLYRPVPQVAVVIDTSSSVSDEDLGSALTELAAIARAVGVAGHQVAVYSCDAAVHTAEAVCRSEEITLVGGGGTDLRRGIKRAAARAPRPDVVVVLTDGDTPWPEAEPGCRVIAGIFRSARRAWFRYDDDGSLIDLRPPAWVETVQLE
ncbi:vWA domain-containing protein [Catenulispora subtropica]|uniref:VWA-like domain-containing protein n=1 Tax=Catenulispora subtropica TaxID=450798 RepID=A0ABN2S7S7_9ACTN